MLQLLAALHSTGRRFQCKLGASHGQDAAELLVIYATARLAAHLAAQLAVQGLQPPGRKRQVDRLWYGSDLSSSQTYVD